MKRLTSVCLIVLISVSIAFSQAPDAFKYQAVACYSNGDVISEQPVGFEISILEDDIAGNAVYIETHLVNTNESGLVNFEIGNGTSSDDFSAINWSDGVFFLKISMDTTGGTNYNLMGASQLLSVPYAMHANGLTLTSPEGHKYSLNVDNQGNISTSYISTNEVVQIDFEGMLYVAPQDYDVIVEWGGYGTTVGATSINDGESNTSIITGALGDNGGVAYAASVCETLDAYGYSDWYLPSKDELNALYENRETIGGFTTETYWSSTEYSEYESYSLMFGTGMLVPQSKDYTRKFRCVRRD